VAYQPRWLEVAGVVQDVLVALPSFAVRARTNEPMTIAAAMS
jgi:hypothetical protein